ncbi:TM2 domain-containing protein [Corynebacterium guangdongense]|uniref:TM2 domain-containing membrane protein YozV n=1 Tax=Corynebacterium guangdongense TaxID=1783348 RepID=A0ABU1ZZD7_9CORY|nr:TM2 domain-containing protein [Corynebacterium guangdongense]MDR7329253.1 TM2 domain-containing membrane protein YozV [Corynebacterium guangdongense]WJZ17819.1 TM2 domain protein [Corynebacterium guangdongense]
MSTPFGNDNQVFYDKDGLPIPPPFHPADRTYPAPGPHYAPMPGRPTVTSPQFVSEKSQVVAALLAFFLGTLGVHNFYLGYTRKGVTQLLLTVVGWLTSLLLIGFVFLAVVGVWALIEFILILLRSGAMGRDARGLPLN